MSTITGVSKDTPTKSRNLVEMNWDPITRIVGSLGIFTKIDFENRHVAECHSTSSIFRGYSIFMKGKDPRDAHFITSRICGICGDNHATCATYAQNMAFGIRPPAIAEWIVNLGEAAEYMFDHNIFQDNLVGVDFCEQMVKETNPKVLAKAETTMSPTLKSSRLPDYCGHHARAESVYRLVLSRSSASEPHDAGNVLPDGRPPRSSVHAISRRRRHRSHHSTLHRLSRSPDEVCRIHEESGAAARRLVRLLLRSAAGLRRSRPAAHPARRAGARSTTRTFATTPTRTCDNGARLCMSRPALSWTGNSSPHDLVDINLNIRILLGSSYYDDWKNAETFVKTDPLGNPVDQNHPWNQTTIPRPQKRDFAGKYTWVMSPRWLDKRTGDHLALDTGGGPIARFWATALAGIVDIGYIKATGHSVKIYLPKTVVAAGSRIRMEDSEVEQCDRTRSRPHLLPGLRRGRRLYFVEKALEELHAGRTKTWTDFKVPESAIGCGFHEAVRGVLSHHVVIKDHKIANYHPYPPTPWNANPRDIYGTPGPYEDAVQNTPIFEENGPDKFKGIDIMRAVRSFDPCLPCGVHMYLGNGKVLETHHSPMFGLQPKGNPEEGSKARPKHPV